MSLTWLNRIFCLHFTIDLDKSNLGGSLDILVKQRKLSLYWALLRNNLYRSYDKDGQGCKVRKYNYTYNLTKISLNSDQNYETLK